MNEPQVRKLPSGLYRLFWKSGGTSLASIGRNSNGRVWFAPCNWVEVPSFNWRPVLSVEEVLLVENKDE